MTEQQSYPVMWNHSALTEILQNKESFQTKSQDTPYKRERENFRR